MTTGMRFWNCRLLAGIGLAAAIGLAAFVYQTRTAFGQQPSSSGPSRSGPSAGSRAPDSGRAIAARVNGNPIYKTDVDQVLPSLSQGQPIEPAAMPQYQAYALQQLISQRLLFDFIEKNDLSAKREEIDQQMEALRAQLKEQKSLTLEQFARQRGETPAGLRNRVASEISFQKFLQHYSKEETIKAYYDRNARNFDGTQIRVSHILLRPKGGGNEAETAELVAKAKEIKTDIESGKLTFADAAKQFSAGPSRTDGGDLGVIGRDGPMVEAFNRAAFELEQGKISDPVVTPFGVHLITVTEVKPGDKTLDDVRTKVMPEFTKWLVEQLIERETKAAKIEFTDGFPHFKPGTRELASAER